MGKHRQKDTPDDKGEVIVDLEQGEVIDTSENPTRTVGEIP